jgi:hypothetical protein
MTAAFRMPAGRPERCTPEFMPALVDRDRPVNAGFLSARRAASRSRHDPLRRTARNSQIEPGV